MHHRIRFPPTRSPSWSFELSASIADKANQRAEAANGDNGRPSCQPGKGSPCHVRCPNVPPRLLKQLCFIRGTGHASTADEIGAVSVSHDWVMVQRAMQDFSETSSPKISAVV